MSVEKRTRSPLARAIMSLGMSTKEFAEKKLGSNYASFQYRVRRGVLRLDEYHKIMQLTGRHFDELFPSPYATSQRIPVNLGTIPQKMSISDNNPRGNVFEIDQPTTTIRLTPQEMKEEPQSVTPLIPAPAVYDEGLPPID